MSLLMVKGLVNYFGRSPVVNGVDFQVSQAEVVGLLGPNGARKTTSFRKNDGCHAHFFRNGQSKCRNKLAILAL